MPWGRLIVDRVPSVLSECYECSALVNDHEETRRNHENWHKKIVMSSDTEACDHPPDAVMWNEWNQVVQCHRCGHVMRQATGIMIEDNCDADD